MPKVNNTTKKTILVSGSDDESHNNSTEEETEESVEEESVEEESVEEESEEDEEKSEDKKTTFVDNSLDETDKTDIRNISIKTVDSKGYFGVGSYGEFKVYIMMMDVPEKGYKKGYINITKICSLKNKEFYDWSKKTSSKLIIKEILSVPEFDGTDLTVRVTSGSRYEAYTRGTYIHPELVPHVVSWISPKFAIKVSKIVNEFITKEAIDKKDKLIRQKNKLLGIKQDKIDTLTDMVKEVLSKNEQISRTTINILNENKKMAIDNRKLSKKADKLSEKADRLLEDNNELTDKANQLLEDNKKTKKQLKKIDSKLNICCDKRVVDTDDNNLSNVFALVRNNLDDENSYEYTTFRTQRKSLKSSFNKHTSKYPDAKIILKLDYAPNSVNLQNRVKEYLKGKIIWKMNSFDLAEDYTEEDLVEDIKYVHSQRFDKDTL